MFGEPPVFGFPLFNSPFRKKGDEAPVPDPSETYFMLYEDGDQMLFDDGANDRMLLENAPE